MCQSHSSCSAIKPITWKEKGKERKIKSERKKKKKESTNKDKERMELKEKNNERKKIERCVYPNIKIFQSEIRPTPSLNIKKKNRKNNKKAPKIF